VVEARPPLARSLFLVIIALLVGTSLPAELRSYARPDTGFLLDAAGRVLDGARLYVDVVEINPPLVVALNAVAVLCARALGLSEILVYRLCFTAILLAALGLSTLWLRRLLPEEVGLRRALVLVLTFVLFPLAGPDYGEREHLVLALLVPYALLATARSVGQRITPMEGVWPGLLAGIAFALKPHFLLVWLMLEAWLRLTRRVPRWAPLPETLAIAGILTTYGLLIVALTPEYLSVLRLLAGPYSRFLHDPFWHLLVTGPGAVLTLFALLTFLALRGQARHPALWVPLALTTGACLVAGAVQQKGLQYHFYPASALATVLLGLVALDSAWRVADRVRLLYRTLAIAAFVTSVAVVSLDRMAAAAGRVVDSDREEFERMVRLVRSHAANADVFVMSYHIRSAYPLINYSGARSGSRFPHLWILAGEYLDELKREGPLRYHERSEMGPSERYLNRAVLQDLERRPKLLLVFRPARDVPLNGYRRLDYVAYFSREPEIKAILQEYQLISQTGDYLVYEWTPPAARLTEAAPAPSPGTQDVVVTREGGASLRWGDPRLLVAALTFMSSLVATGLSARSRVAGPGDQKGVATPQMPQ
jgi:hypothetical protein